MLRECHRVLKPEGVLAGYVIHTPQGLTPAQEQEAIDLGPSAVGSEHSPAELATTAGFRDVRAKDVTDTFLATLDRLISARLAYEAELRDLKGDQVWEEDHADSEGKRRGVILGLLKRSFIVARK